ncbi:MAG: tRNA (guanosine(37)-N1)-methyltransferase TrmD [Acidobacteriia bacterium]|nr:tRNA (guanosine(37)-N1)-methyltransferase TrmD [Terriglobia bacterium]
MTFDVITIFPEFFRSILDHGLLKRGVAGGHAAIRLHDLRDFTDDRHRTVDDRPFGGGPGMVFKPEPIFRAVEALKAEGEEKDFPVILLSPQGRLLTQAVAEELARQPRVVLICGRYEGVDERVAVHLATDEISIGDFVLSGGELPAAVLMETVIRLLPGVLGNEESSRQDSFAATKVEDGNSHGWLDCPHYTRPTEFRGYKVPEILLSGNHEEIRRWRRQRAIEKTWRRRPELLAGVALNEEDRRWLESLQHAAARL